MMKKTIAFLLMIVMTFSLTACGSKDSGTQVSNPFTEYDSLDEASKAVGFDLSFPNEIDGYPNQAIRVCTDLNMAEVIYTNDDEDKICIRKALGADDISGDYNEYSQSNAVSVGDLNVTMQGDNDLISLATWTNNEYTYSIGVYEQSGITAEAMSSLVSTVQ